MGIGKAPFPFAAFAPAAPNAAYDAMIGSIPGIARTKSRVRTRVTPRAQTGSRATTVTET